MLLDDIKQLNLTQLKDLKLSKAVFSKKDRTLNLEFASKEKLDESLEREISAFVKSQMKGGVKTSVKFFKDYFDEEKVKGEFFNYIKREYLFFSTRIAEDNVCVSKTDDVFVLTVTVTPELEKMLVQIDFLPCVEKHFADITNFEVKCKFDVVESNVDVENLMKATQTMRETQVTKALFKPQRKIDVEDVQPLFGNFINQKPQYIIDVTRPEKSVTLCGMVEGIKEVVTNSGYTLFKFDLSDFTGKISVIVFSDDKIYLKLKELQVGDQILLNGQVKENSFSQELEMHAYRICRCKILEEKFESSLSRPVPEAYVIVKPEKFEKEEQGNLFSEKRVSPKLLGKSFVVFDFETTGKNYLSCKIIEIGAVKVVDGVITETFSTFVNPECKISREITELTGITDDMVEHAPTFPEIISDFYKFCYGSTLIAHNIEFDIGFLKFNTKDSGFNFSNPQIDTLALSRKYFRSLQGGVDTPKNFKLGTLAEFLGVSRENAHRATDDSIMAADIFIKLVEMGADF